MRKFLQIRNSFSFSVVNMHHITCHKFQNCFWGWLPYQSQCRKLLKVQVTQPLCERRLVILSKIDITSSSLHIVPDVGFHKISLNSMLTNTSVFPFVKLSMQHYSAPHNTVYKKEVCIYLLSHMYPNSLYHLLLLCINSEWWKLHLIPEWSNINLHNSSQTNSNFPGKSFYHFCPIQFPIWPIIFP